MKRLLLIFSLVMVFCLSYGQNAKEARKILDKTAQTLYSKSGAKANFSASGKLGNVSGTVAVKGNKFYAYTPASVVWYDGRTQWTYMKKSQEVNISTPTEAQQQSMNPYKFLYIYKNGYKLSVKKLGNGWQVHMDAVNQGRTIKEMYVTVSKNYQLQTVKMRQSGGWTTIRVSNFRKVNLSDSHFRFNSKEYPNAEVIDLR